MTISSININQIREEICHFLRNQDVLTTTIRGVTTVTETSTATAGQTTITPTHSDLKNVRVLTINATAKYFINDFTIEFETGIITLLVALTGGEAISIQYDYGTDKIFPDMIRDNLKLESFPRIGIKPLSLNSEEMGIGGIAHVSKIVITVYVWMPANKVSTIAGGLGGNDDISYYMSLVRSKILNNAKSFYSFPYIHPVSGGPIIPSTNNKIIQVSQDFELKFVVEK